MFRVKLNLWTNKAVSDEASEDIDASRHGDWVDEQKRVDTCLTREEMCQTFQEKFPTRRDPEVKHIA